MSVHKEISKHVESQRERIQKFHLLEEKREKLIDEVIAACKNGEDFSVDLINEVTNQINVLARQGAVPTRKLVTKEMVLEYVNRNNS